jgi:SOS-response transcriptional repressor LexA
MSYNADSLRATEGVSVHTGFPNPATDASLRTLDLNKILVAHSASTYFFRVRGQEWEAVGVFDGDVAIVDRALDPRQADVVLWWDGARAEFSVSTYKHMPRYAALWGVITSTIHQFRKVIPE